MYSRDLVASPHEIMSNVYPYGHYPLVVLTGSKPLASFKLRRLYLLFPNRSYIYWRRGLPLVSTADGLSLLAVIFAMSVAIGLVC